MWLVASLHCLKLEAFLSVVNSNYNSHGSGMRDWECINENWHAILQGCTEFMSLKRSSMKTFLSTCHLVRCHFGQLCELKLSIYNGVYHILVGILLCHLFTINILSIVGIGKPIIAVPLLC